MSLRKLEWAYTWHPVPRKLENSIPHFDPATRTLTDLGQPHVAWQDRVYTIYWVPVLLAAVVGGILTWRQHRQLLLLYLVILENAAELVAAYPDTRYRLTVDPFFTLFAGVTLVLVWNKFKQCSIY